MPVLAACWHGVHTSHATLQGDPLDHMACNSANTGCKLRWC